jgi:hypothetical protein
MNKKFTIYAIIVTVLTTALSWQDLLAAQTNDRYHSGASRGSGWSSFMGGGSWAGGSGGHK